MKHRTIYDLGRSQFIFHEVCHPSLQLRLQPLLSGEEVVALLARFRLFVAFSESGCSSVGHLDPLRTRCGRGIPSGSNRHINFGFRRILRRGASTVVAHCSLHRRDSGRGDNPYGGSWVDPFAMRINSIQGHAPAHSLAQGKIGWCHSEHSAKGSGQMRSIGKPGAMSRGGDGGATHQVASCPLQPEPEDIRRRGTSTDAVKMCMKCDGDRPDIPASVFKEKSSEVPSFARRYLSARFTRG